MSSEVPQGNLSLTQEDGVSTEIPLSARTTLPVLISYSSANKQHDPRHPTSQTTAVTRKSSLVHGSSVIYSSTKGVTERFAKLAPVVEGEAKRERERVNRDAPVAGGEGTSDWRRVQAADVGPSVEETEPSLPSPPVAPRTVPRAEPPRDPLEDPQVQQGLKIMEWGDDGLSEYTSLDMRMHRGIR